MTIRRKTGPAQVGRARALLAAALAVSMLAVTGMSPAGAVPIQVLQNTGFEAGTPSNPTPWVPESDQAGRVLVSTTAPHAGARSADLCNRNDCNDILSQAFAVPGNYTSAKLRFSYRFDSTDPRTDCPDILSVAILRLDFSPITESDVCNGDVPNGSYHDRETDISGPLNSFRGQNVITGIGGFTDADFLSRMWVDDVTVTFDSVAPSAPVSVTATATGSGGATVTWGAPSTGEGITSYTVTPSAGSSGSPVTVSSTTRTASFSGLTGSAVTFTVTATNPAGTSAPATSNAVNATAATPVRDMVSDRQYQLTGSDGVSWADLDTTNLATTYTPPDSGQLLLDANIDLWTADPGVNQDVAVVVGGGVYGSGTVVGWKESGGFAGTFSPNAAAVNTAVDVVAGTAYTVKLAWKANQAAPGKTIFAGAGPIGGGFSPTRVTASFLPTSNPVDVTKRTDQFLLTGNDGTTWTSMNMTNAGGVVAPVSRTFTASADGIAAVTGNADLWTWNAQYNQDLALKLSGGVYGTGQIVAWKESGGFAGTFSPNAALVEARVPVLNGVAYTVELVWKANKPMPAGVRISAAAGSAGNFSPTTITVAQQPTTAVASKAAATQYRLDGSDGVTWQNLDTPAHDQSPFNVTYVAPSDGYVHLVGNTDLWTYAAGYNQDIGIKVTPPGGDPGTAPGGIVAWKESGGFAGTFSPNAAAVEGFYPVKTGLSYTFTLVWKMNKPATPSVSISAGAGGPGNFGPTRLDLRFQPS